jgi:hypothetical protein
MMYYINYFQGNFSFFLNKAHPTYLTDVKKKVKSMDESWNLSGNPNILSPPRTKVDHKKKATPTTEPPPILHAPCGRNEEDANKFHIDDDECNA